MQTNIPGLTPSTTRCNRLAQRSSATTRALRISSPNQSAQSRRSSNVQLHQLVYELVNILALPAEPSQDNLQLWRRNIDVLHDVHGAAGAERVRKTVLANPALLAADLEIWHSFFVSGFGLPPDSFAKLASDCPALLTQGNVFTAGSCMLFFKSMGWRNKDIAQRIIGYYPQLLLLDRRRDIDPVLRFLDRMDCRGENLRLLIWEFPRIFDKDYRRHVRKFQYLGVYGLSLTAGQSNAVRKGDDGGRAAAGGDGPLGGGATGNEVGYRNGGFGGNPNVDGIGIGIVGGDVTASGAVILRAEAASQ